MHKKCEIDLLDNFKWIDEGHVVNVKRCLAALYVSRSLWRQREVVRQAWEDLEPWRSCSPPSHFLASLLTLLLMRPASDDIGGGENLLWLVVLFSKLASWFSPPSSPAPSLDYFFLSTFLFSPSPPPPKANNQMMKNQTGQNLSNKGRYWGQRFPTRVLWKRVCTFSNKSISLEWLPWSPSFTFFLLTHFSEITQI